jgi:2-hydroxychromene-2-carboxylate isomerase
MEAVVAEKELPNLRVLVPIRVGGIHRAEGSVIPKTDFANKGDWHDLTVMEPARLAETDAKVGTAKGDKTPLPGL